LVEVDCVFVGIQIKCKINVLRARRCV
jgi:hypothetical protein